MSEWTMPREGPERRKFLAGRLRWLALTILPEKVGCGIALEILEAANLLDYYVPDQWHKAETAALKEGTFLTRKWWLPLIGNMDAFKTDAELAATVERRCER